MHSSHPGRNTAAGLWARENAHLEPGSRHRASADRDGAWSRNLLSFGDLVFERPTLCESLAADLYSAIWSATIAAMVMLALMYAPKCLARLLS
eukprot:CAMPEP_0198727880 /NCGR_PEP_ID=MMETSP1475-20131203/6040_1 /TAXON_ID= ORGANISM="Unidentified sp., Strain CCMP1999" /NCGR_SAMPLE_ID=MMETSP1475 /ASSEMBLY_ACC=CAM_ASM_001111 /LENGTH=92 /DNA_ID=CAMNT_0044490073 /DNA_START=53 /DNA_END=331 /DNA_ORIENTATION=-